MVLFLYTKHMATTTAPQKKKLPWWANMLMQIGIEVVIQVASYFTFGGAESLNILEVGEAVGTEAVESGISAGARTVTSQAVRRVAKEGLEAGMRVAGTISVDEASGYNDPFTLVSDTVMSFMPFISRAYKELNVIYNPLDQLAKRLGMDELKSVGGKLEELQRIKGISPAEYVERYNAILLEKYKIDLGQLVADPKAFLEATYTTTSRTGLKTTKTALADIVKARNSFTRMKAVNGVLRKSIRLVSYVSPEYTAKRITSWLLKDFKKVLNKKIVQITNKLAKFNPFKAFTQQQYRRLRQILNHTLIPLNHIAEPWIMGVQLKSAYKLPNIFDMTIWFDPEYTTSNANPSGKHKVLIHNANITTDILPFLESESAGRYYLDELQWGRTIGKLIRNNMFLLGIAYNPWLSQYISTAMAVRRLATHVYRMTKAEYWKRITQFKAIGTGAIEGAIRGTKIPFARMGTAIIRSTEQHSAMPLAQYSKRRARSSIRAYARQKNTSMLQKKYKDKLIKI